jgi:kinesin family protein 3/17
VACLYPAFISAVKCHRIFTLALTRTVKRTAANNPLGAADGTSTVVCSKLRFVILGGCERRQRRQRPMATARQSPGIGVGLSIAPLGNVISALVDRRARHIPYRDSKLTHLLQDALGGTASTVWLAHCSPREVDHDESMSTLRCAQRASCITNKQD